MRRDKHVNITVDEETDRLLRQLAELESEGNRSQYLRRLIRLAGRALAAGQPEVGNAAQESDAN